MNRKILFKVNPACNQPNDIPETSGNTFTFALPSTSVSATRTISQKRRSQKISSPEVLKSWITKWNTQEHQTPIAMPGRGSTVSFGMLTPQAQTPSTSFDLNDDVAMDYVCAEARENVENGGLWGCVVVFREKMGMRGNIHSS
jgi:hypothetical protein